MAKLQLPQNNLDAIKQDYQDKHTSVGAVLICRKYDRQVKDKDGQPVFDRDGKPVNYKGWYEAKSLTTNEVDYVRSSHFLSERNHNDCYSTLNHFPIEYPPEIFDAMNKGQMSYRSADNLQYMTGFYLDLDHIAIHNLAKKQQASIELVQEVLGYADFIVQTLENYTDSTHISFDTGFGMPVITFTGGGYGFYFPLIPIPATPDFKALYMDMWEKLYRRFSLLFADILDVFENDHAVLDFSRVIRITGTYNSKTGAFAQYIGRYGDDSTNEVYAYSLDDIRFTYRLDEITVDSSMGKLNTRLVKDSPLQKKEKEEEKKKEQQRSAQPAQEPPAYAKRGSIAYPTKWYQGYANSKQIAKYLELAVKSLEYLDGQGALQRNNALFLAACFKTEIEYAKYGYYIFGNVCGDLQLEIFHYVQSLNDSLAKPLEKEELKDLVKSALSNQYHFRRLATVQKFLNLTNAEFETLGWLEHQKKEEQKQERNNALTDLDKDVIKLYLSGMSDAKIAERVGITKRTSINIRQRLGVTDRSVKWEDIDFDGNKRHVKHDTKAQVPEPAPIYPYMPWYKPTPKTMYVRDYRTNSTLIKNAVVERAQALAGCSEGFDNLIDLQMRLSVLRAQVAQMSEAEKREILAAICVDA